MNASNDLFFAQKLEKLIDEIGIVHRKLILLISSPRTDKSNVLYSLAKRKNITPLNIGAELGGKLTAVPNRQRQMEVNTILNELSCQHTNDNLLLVDNIELLFDRTLKLDPLDLLKRQAISRRVVAVWPGEIRNNRLVYAVIGHPEYQDYSLEGLIPFEIQ